VILNNVKGCLLGICLIGILTILLPLPLHCWKFCIRHCIGELRIEHVCVYNGTVLGTAKTAFTMVCVLTHDARGEQNCF
jgi:hypothetical protein